MTRLIDAWKLCEYANNLKDKCVDANDIMRFPTEDAVPVIRCKDCKYHEQAYQGAIWCDTIEAFADENWFCATGERKES